MEKMQDKGFKSYLEETTCDLVAPSSRSQQIFDLGQKGQNSNFAIGIVKISVIFHFFHQFIEFLPTFDKFTIVDMFWCLIGL